MKFKLVEEFDSGLYNKSTIDTLIAYMITIETKLYY